MKILLCRTKDTLKRNYRERLKDISLISSDVYGYPLTGD